ncbi:stage V sporulation protein AA [Paenibacillus sp. FSL W8-1187]|uniref:Stage V sporulation protein AA (SpoVAA) n=1 Tax=Paenibacillus pasadenensis TaxID=217090 RepID=A0A2N5N5K4_9BACL|nr:MULTISPECIES: stage V sporulation protein AA [Paenibacillus]PLT45590.1 Stage V sporulation protein AA (SpoVAA) [Paenibacillus pasadenensis]QGG56045.1 stage V sporulation protein AA [Paenibacillus sp. B01]
MSRKRTNAGPIPVYLRLKKRISIPPEGTVRLGSVVRLLADEPLAGELKRIPLYTHRPEDGNRVVIDVLQIVKALRETAPDAVIETFGDPQVLILVETPSTRSPRFAVLAGAWLLLFFGAGLAIMNFHTDVSMKEVHQRIAFLLTGKETLHPLWFQIPYSVGVGLGMVLFFNHLFRKRLNEEPNPLELEMYNYQENINAYVIADEMGKKANRVEGRDDG